MILNKVVNLDILLFVTDSSGSAVMIDCSVVIHPEGIYRSVQQNLEFKFCSKSRFSTFKSPLLLQRTEWRAR